MVWRDGLLAVNGEDKLRKVTNVHTTTTSFSHDMYLLEDLRIFVAKNHQRVVFKLVDAFQGSF